MGSVVARAANFCCSECAGRVSVSIGSPRRRIGERFRWAIAHPMTATASKILAAVIASLVISDVGCSRSPTHGAGQSPETTAWRVLSADEAAQLAAKLANDQCDRLYQKCPFSAAQHSAVRQKGMYQWGGLDVGGPGGFSALVTFRPDGSQPHVEVYFSTDVF